MSERSSSTRLVAPSHRAPQVRDSASLVFAITAGAALLMTAYEALKEWVLPHWSKWESHTLTILVTTAIAGVAATYVHRKQAAAAAEISRREQDLRILLQSIGDAVIATDREGLVTLVNPVAARLTGYTETDAIGRPITEVFDIRNADSMLTVPSPVHRVVESGMVVGLANHTVLVRSDGAHLAIADSGAPIFDTQGKVVGVVIVFRDVTEEYRLQNQAHQAEKLDSLGLLAGGIAHDFNNLLTAISGAAEVLQLESKVSDDTTREQLDIIRKATIDAKSVTNRLLSFARRQPIVSKPLDVHQVVRDTLSLLERTIDKRIEIVAELNATHSVVLGDSGQLVNVLLNLGINAARAMPSGGKISFATATTELDAEQCENSPFELQPGRYVRIEVRDTGEGMSPDRLKRVFDPFFTMQKEGIGLGLSAVYGSVRQHKGAVTVYSEPGAGTVFRVMLRLTNEPIIERNAPAVITGKGRVLLIEDEPDIRNISSRFLKRMGFEVTTSEDGEAALETFRGAEGKYDLVILDMVMPKMSGAECFHALRALNPAVKVLLCSGFVGGNDVDALLREGARGFISKPYQYNELSQAIAEAISGE